MAEAIKKKRILIYSLIFSPDGVSTAYLYNDLALGFKDRGHEVVVLTTTPHFNPLKEELQKQPLKRIFFGVFFTSNFKGIKVYHIPLKKHKNISLRIFSFFYWHIASFLVGLGINKIDYILSPSPPLTNGFIAIILSRIKKAKVIYNVQEVYPDLLINQGFLKSNFLIKILKSLEAYIYNNSYKVTTIDQLFYKLLFPRIKIKERLEIIPNFVDTDFYKPILNTDQNLNQAIFSKNEGDLNIMYAGNIGEAQEWDLLLNTALKVKDLAVTFWIIGGGAKKEYLKNRIVSQKLNNIKLFPYQSRDNMPALNLFADIHFIGLTKEVEFEGFPSKVYSILASAKPILAVASIGTPLYNFLKDKDCSFIISERASTKLVDLIISLINDKSKLDIMGRNGYNHIIANFSKDKIINAYLGLIEK